MAKMTKEEMDKRFDEISSRPAEALTIQEAISLARAEKENDGSLVELEEFKKSLEGYSGRIVLRLPKSLHRSLKAAAKVEGVSLNQYLLYKLST